MAKQSKWQKRPSQCPQCKIELQRKTKILKSHFNSLHGREPTQGEINQFKTHRTSSAPYTDKDFIKPKIEVSGGGFSSK